MLGHVGINLPDLGAAKHYYAAIMPLVGFEMYIDADDQFAYRPMAAKPGTYLFFYPSAEQSRYSRHHTGLQHLAFMVPTRSAVNAVHIVVAELAGPFGGSVVHEPQVFPQYPQPYFNIRSRTSRRSGSTHGASCSKRYAITTATDRAQRNPLQQSNPANGSAMTCRSFRSDRCVSD